LRFSARGSNPVLRFDSTLGANTATTAKYSNSVPCCIKTKSFWGGRESFPHEHGQASFAAAVGFGGSNPLKDIGFQGVGRPKDGVNTD
jgi:hypothetical protein